MGADPLSIEACTLKMDEAANYYGRVGAGSHAMAGINIALWDIAGKAAGQPISRLLGGPIQTRFRAYCSILFGDTPPPKPRAWASPSTRPPSNSTRYPEHRVQNTRWRPQPAQRQESLIPNCSRHSSNCSGRTCTHRFSVARPSKLDLYAQIQLEPGTIAGQYRRAQA